MPYRCQKCMNTFKTLSLYNRHAVDCKQVKSENQTQSNNGQQRSYSSQGAVVKRSFSDSGGGQQGSYPDSKRLNAKIDFRNNEDKQGHNRDTIKQEIKPMQTVVEMRRPIMMNNGMNGPRLYRCFECDSAFDTKTNLETHMREGHKDKFCDECEDEFSWPDESHDCYYTRYSLRYIAGDIVPSF